MFVLSPNECLFAHVCWVRVRRTYAVPYIHTTYVDVVSMLCPLCEYEKVFLEADGRAFWEKERDKSI